MRRLTPPTHPDLVVGTEHSDDAAAWRLDSSRLLLSTADVITPVVDDARDWGMVAAANAASDVYAMGGQPLLALNLVAWNTAALGLDLLGDLLAGAAEVAAEGGFLLVGGHTIEADQPTFGLSVTGTVRPDELLANTGLVAGDSLVLTKALGVGVLTTALKADRLPPGCYEPLVGSMRRLNAQASVVARHVGARGATDVTGFGFLGHLRRLCDASGVDAVVDVQGMPLLPGALQAVSEGMVPGGSRRNLAWVEEVLERGATPQDRLLLLADAQTSGGLLFGAPRAAAAEAVSELRESGHDARVVGTLREGPGRLVLEP